MSTPLVSVCLITYKQQAYVAQALDGIVNQVQGGFNMEVIVGDDCSPDNTLSVIQEYASKYPDLIKVSERKRNLGMHGNWEQTIHDCSGDYIAIIEGDDRWDDNQKLAKQVALLEENKSASASFSNAKVLKEDGNFSPYNYVDKLGHGLTAKEFFALNANPIPTCTTVFRKSMFEGFQPSYYNSPFADWILHSTLIQKGGYLYLNECSSTYRQHNEGVWSGIEKER
ncbi:MAG: glycosyltransferase, partial [Flavobacteriales bacterium]